MAGTIVVQAGQAPTNTPQPTNTTAASRANQHAGGLGECHAFLGRSDEHARSWRHRSSRDGWA